MKIQNLVQFLVLQLLTAVWAVFCFRIIEDRQLAGNLAGLAFILLGVFILYKGRKWPQRWHLLHQWVAWVHLFAMALPMYFVRWFSQKDFKDLHILGLPATTYHRISEIVYLLLFVATIIDLLLLLRSRRALQKSAQDGR